MNGPLAYMAYRQSPITGWIAAVCVTAGLIALACGVRPHPRRFRRRR